jgi:hypothetical protein
MVQLIIIKRMREMKKGKKENPNLTHYTDTRIYLFTHACASPICIYVFWMKEHVKREALGGTSIQTGFDSCTCVSAFNTLMTAGTSTASSLFYFSFYWFCQSELLLRNICVCAYVCCLSRCRVCSFLFVHACWIYSRYYIYMYIHIETHRGESETGR